MDKESVGSGFIEQFLVYIGIFIALVIIIYGIRQIYLGLKQKEK